MNRMIKLLKYLNKNYPADNWGQFYSENTIDFKKCLLTGHSQGGGHAAYLAKKYEADRVICFSSPADYSELYKHSASWCSQYFATPVDRFYGLMHKRDEVIPSKEIYSIWKDMRMLLAADTSSAERPTFINYKALYINYPENIAAGKFKARHNMPVMDVSLPVGPGADQIKEVWKYFLTE